MFYGNKSDAYQALVIGGGHAAIEAALALCRLGNMTLLVTQNIDTIGRLSCNPSIGGLGKGHLVREIDALGGEMAKLIDQCALQYRILNRRRGPAVQAPRAQADRYLYSRLARQTLFNAPNLNIYQAEVSRLMLSHGHVAGVLCSDGEKIAAQVVIVAAGTFLGGKIFIGKNCSDGGRLHEPAANLLADSLTDHKIELGRLKTGTPPRIAGSSIDFEQLQQQQSETENVSFAFTDIDDQPPRGSLSPTQLPCYLAYSNRQTHAIIARNLSQSPLFSGEIIGSGPRYCPSIEDKVKRFPDRSRHQIFVEPESGEQDEYYLSGVSTSLPIAVQRQFIATINGFSHARITRPGYAVEYYYIDPRQLGADLMCKKIAGLFFAGQVNGSSGYEEAAAQGLIAGINAHRFLNKDEPLIISRGDAYIGVLIDDLINGGVDEPYRMFTARAEFRLSLRHDNADRRLLPIGYRTGLNTKERLLRLEQKKTAIARIVALLENHIIKRGSANFAGLEGKSAAALLKMPQFTITDLFDEIPALGDYPLPWVVGSALDIKYSGYLLRQKTEIERVKRMEKQLIPADFDYDSLSGLSTESKERLNRLRPHSIGQAARIPSIRPSDIALLTVLLRRGSQITKV